MFFNPDAEHHMGMPAMYSEWTVELLDALPDDGQRYELIDGELFVTPSPAGTTAPLAIAIPDLFAQALG